MMALPKIQQGDKPPLDVSPQSSPGSRKAKFYHMSSCAELFRRSLSQIIQPQGLTSSSSVGERKEREESCIEGDHYEALQSLNSKPQPQSTPGGGYEESATTYVDESEAQHGGGSSKPRREAAWKRLRRNEVTTAPRTSAVRNNGPSVPDFSLRPLFVKQFFYRVSEWELSKICVKVTPDMRERNRKNAIFSSLNEIVHSLSATNDITLDVTGSTACDIDATHSDLDLAVTAPRADPLAVLQEISNLVVHAQFGRSPDWPLSKAQVSLVHRARVPILSIRLQNAPTMNCDISVNTANSMRHTELFQKLLHERPILRPVMRLVKHWLRERHIPSMREGGLPTIGWMVLAVTETGISVLNGHSPYNNLHENDLYSLAAKNSARALLQECLSTSARSIGEGKAVEDFQDNKILFSIMNFFHLLKDREKLTKTVSLMQPSHNTAKNLQEVFERVLSPQNHGGVWDELLTIEDPASILEPSYSPYNAEDFGLLSFTSPASRTPTYLDESMQRRQTLKFDFAIGDLASKISSATWLVYQFELLRADFLFSVFRLFEALVSTESSKCSFMANSNHFYQRMEELSDLPVALTASVFKSLPEFMYLVPVRTVEDDRPSWYSDFVLVLLEGDLHVIRLKKICIDWKSWWSQEFLSRRDIRSAMHGHLCDVCITPSTSSDGSESEKCYVQVLERKENIILNPCNFVSRVHVRMTDGLDPIYYIDDSEAVRLATFRVLATQAPYWKTKVARKLQPLALPLQSIKLQCMTCETGPDTGSLSQILDYNALDDLASVDTDVFFLPLEDLQSLKYLDEAFGVEIPLLLRMAEDIFRQPPPPPPSYPPKTAYPRQQQTPPLTSSAPTAQTQKAKLLHSHTGHSPEQKRSEKQQRIKKPNKLEKKQKNTSRRDQQGQANQGPTMSHQDSTGASAPELVANDRQNSSSSRKESRDTSSSTADNWTHSKAPIRLAPHCFVRLQNLLPKDEAQSALMGKTQRPPNETK
eukprot:GHVP01060077.1.p1 GENE.GHVP01060077.1~~GHVP01060077.1.p1  ORF type:complete len:987 (-),score=176.59 GHVP01060077.1:232-3192(-)